MDTTLRVLGEISELALSSPSHQAFWREVMNLLHHAIGFDAGHLMSTDGDVASARLTVEGHSEGVLRTLVPGWLAEVPGEIVARIAAEATSIFDVVQPKERHKYALYREFYEPAGTKSLLARVHWSSGRATGYSLERTGHARPFQPDELRNLDVLVPLVAVADRYVLSLEAQASHPEECFRLSAREAQITDLLVRGFRNAEIARLLRISPHTVRNILHSLFQKANVSTRTELALVVSSGRAQVTGSDNTQRRPMRAASRQLAVYLGHIQSAAGRTQRHAAPRRAM